MAATRVHLHREAATEPVACPRCGQASRTVADLLASDGTLRARTAWCSHGTGAHRADMRAAS